MRSCASSCGKSGRPFDSFAEFAIALPPTGLGVRSLPPLKMLRYALLANGNFAHWTDLLERTAREPGRPTKKLVNDEGFARFYTIPTASTARDRLLLALKRNHPEHFAAVCRLECSPREAGIRAGLVKVGRWHYGRRVRYHRGGSTARTSAGAIAVRTLQGDGAQCAVHVYCARNRAAPGCRAGTTLAPDSSKI